MIVVPLIAGASLEEGDATFTVSKGGAAIDLTGATVMWQRRHQQSAAGIAEESRPMTVVDAGAGQCTIAYSAEQSASLRIGLHACEISAELVGGQVVKISGVVLRVSEGLTPQASP